MVAAFTGTEITMRPRRIGKWTVCASWLTPWNWSPVGSRPPFSLWRWNARFERDNISLSLGYFRFNAFVYYPANVQSAADMALAPLAVRWKERMVEVSETEPEIVAYAARSRR